MIQKNVAYLELYTHTSRYKKKVSEVVFQITRVIVSGTSARCH
jgi:hypothetical protein